MSHDKTPIYFDTEAQPDPNKLPQALAAAFVKPAEETIQERVARFDAICNGSVIKFEPKDHAMQVLIYAIKLVQNSGIRDLDTIKTFAEVVHKQPSVEGTDLILGMLVAGCASYATDTGQNLEHLTQKAVDRLWENLEHIRSHRILATKAK